MIRHPLRIEAFIAVLCAAAALLFAWSLPLTDSLRWQDLALFVAMASLAELWYVRISRESGLSLSFTVHFTAAVLFGPAVAMLIAIGGLLVTDGLVRRAPPIRTAFNMTQMAVAVGLCGIVYQVVHVPGPIDLLADAPALALAALVYLVVNDTLVAALMSIMGRSFWQEWRLSVKDILLPYVSMAPLGALAAYAYESTPWALLYFVPLVFVVYNGFKLYVSLQRETDEALVALADSIDRRDKYTFEHSTRVAGLVEATAQWLHLPPREADMIIAAARVHDLGKIGTDSRLLFKPTPLTAEERRLVQQHALEGERLADRFSMFRQGRRCIRHHHERWDGAGYPDGLAETQIPLGARLIAIADAYDSMTSDRPYRKAWAHDFAVKELEHCAGTQFDPTLVRAFIEMTGGEWSAASASSPADRTLNEWPPQDVVAELSARHDPAQVWAAAGFTLARLVRVPDCRLYRRNESQDLICVASISQGEWCEQSLGAALDLSLHGSTREAMSAGEPLLICAPDDARLSQAERSDMLAWGESSKAVVPLVARDAIVGLAEIGESRAGRRITAEQLAAAESLCRLIAVTVHDTEVIDEQKLHTRRLASLLESSRAVASAASTEEVLAIVARRTCELFELTSCIAYEHEPELEAVVARAAWERTPSDWNRLGELLPLASCPVERELLASGGSRLERLSDPALDPASRATMERRGVKSCLTVAMGSADGPMGLLTLWDSTCERHFGDDELALANSLAELAGEALRSARMVRRLQSLSETDSLTGLANHRKLRESLGRAHAQAARYGGTFGLVMLDIDGFKRLNDTHGHLAGDDVLRQVAQLLEQQTRAADVVGRYGGDEFLLVLPEATAGEAARLAEKIRAALGTASCVTLTGERFPLRASFGVASYPEDARDVEALVAVADANLYASKHGGGDAVTGRGHGRPASGDAASVVGLPRRESPVVPRAASR